MEQSLPDDIIRIIFEVLALQSSRNDALRLFTVSRNVKAWTECHVFSKVVLRTMTQVLSFSAAVQGGTAFCNPARHVRLLWFFCTNPSAADHLECVIPMLPSLIHFAFDGGQTPFKKKLIEKDVDRPRITRLSIISPSLLDKALYGTDSPIPWDHLTHFHFFATGDEKFYDLFFGPLVERLGSLQHLLIDLTYPLANLGHESLYADMVFSLLRSLFERLPQLQRLVIKANLPHIPFHVLWDGLRTMSYREPRVVPIVRLLPNKEFRRDTFKDQINATYAWSTRALLQDALSDVDILWASTPQVCHFVLLYFATNYTNTQISIDDI